MIYVIDDNYCQGFSWYTLYTDIKRRHITYDALLEYLNLYIHDDEESFGCCETVAFNYCMKDAFLEEMWNRREKITLINTKQNL